MTYDEWLEKLLERIRELNQKEGKHDLLIMFGRIDPKTTYPEIRIMERGL